MTKQTPSLSKPDHIVAEEKFVDGHSRANRVRYRRPRRWVLAGLALLFAAGAFLLAAIALLPRDQTSSSEPVNAAGFPLQAQDVAPLSIPPDVAGFALRTHLFGPAAADEINGLHRGNFRLTGAAIAVYGDAEATVWVGGTEDASRARLIISQMTESIARSDTPFTPVGERQLRGITVYELTGIGQIHYYFQVGDRIYWLAAVSDRADRGLRELLDFALEAD